MIRYEIPGQQAIEIHYLTIDYNGTLAADGQLIEGVENLLIELSKVVKVYILTADTYGSVKRECQHLPVEIATFPEGKASDAKKSLVESLGPDQCACLGNGHNDVDMMRISALAVAVIDEEGSCSRCLQVADIVARSAQSALGIFLNPNRVKATLRH